MSATRHVSAYLANYDFIPDRGRTGMWRCKRCDTNVANSAERATVFEIVALCAKHEQEGCQS